MKKASLVFTVALCICIGMITPAEGCGNNQPKDRYYFEKQGAVLWEVQTDRKIIALTFDDGPDPKHTEQILNVLKQYEAKATFFAVGQRIHDYPEISKRIATEGHELANHTYHHVYFRSPVNQQQVERELELTEQEILKITGKRSGLFRPPGGYYDEHLVELSNRLGLKPVLWSWHQDTKDWSHPGVDKIYRKVISNAKKGDIVLFHDHVAGPSQTVQALKIILPALEKQGFQFVTVSEMMKLGQ